MTADMAIWFCEHALHIGVALLAGTLAWVLAEYLF